MAKTIIIQRHHWSLPVNGKYSGLSFRSIYLSMNSWPLSIPISDSIGSVSAEIIAPEELTSVYVFAHGAGAGMNHPFMVKMATALARHHIGTLRYNFPFMEKGGKRPDPPAIAEKTVSMVMNAAHELFPDKPLFAGGKSFGGRMTSQLLSKSQNHFVKGLVFVGFPLHPAGNIGVDRAMHLAKVHIPMLFLQGTRDDLADIGLMEKICADHPLATLRKFDGANHAFKAGKVDLIESLAETLHSWLTSSAGLQALEVSLP